MTQPRHVAIVMDGNGRWARQRLLPRAAGHKAGIGPVRLCIEQCAQRGIEALTLFAFSSENWARPDEEVSSLMGLFLSALEREVAELHSNQVRLRFIGDVSTLSAPLQASMAGSQSLTAANTGFLEPIAWHAPEVAGTYTTGAADPNVMVVAKASDVANASLTSGR